MSMPPSETPSATETTDAMPRPKKPPPPPVTAETMLTIPDKVVQDWPEAAMIKWPPGTKWVLVDAATGTFQNAQNYWIPVVPCAPGEPRLAALSAVKRVKASLKVKKPERYAHRLVYHTDLTDYDNQKYYDDRTCAKFLAAQSSAPNKLTLRASHNVMMRKGVLKPKRPGCGRAAVISDGHQTYILAQNFSYLLSGGYFESNMDKLLPHERCSGRPWLTAFDVRPPVETPVLLGLPIHAFMTMQVRPSEAQQMMRKDDFGRFTKKRTVEPTEGVIGLKRPRLSNAAGQVDISSLSNVDGLVSGIHGMAQELEDLKYRLDKLVDTVIHYASQAVAANPDETASEQTAARSVGSVSRSLIGGPDENVDDNGHVNSDALGPLDSMADDADSALAAAVIDQANNAAEDGVVDAVQAEAVAAAQHRLNNSVSNGITNAAANGAADDEAGDEDSEDDEADESEDEDIDDTNLALLQDFNANGPVTKTE